MTPNPQNRPEPRFTGTQEAQEGPSQAAEACRAYLQEFRRLRRQGSLKTPPRPSGSPKPRVGGSGIEGIIKDGRAGRWRTWIWVDGKKRFVPGTYLTVAEAASVREAAIRAEAARKGVAP